MSSGHACPEAVHLFQSFLCNKSQALIDSKIQHRMNKIVEAIIEDWTACRAYRLDASISLAASAMNYVLDHMGDNSSNDNGRKESIIGGYCPIL